MASKKTLVSGGSPEEHRHHGARDRDRHAGAEQAPGVGGRRGAELVAAAGDVAHDERHARHEAAGEAAAGQVVAGEQQVQRHDDDRVEEDPHDHLEHDRAVLGAHALAADQPRHAPAAALVAALLEPVRRLDERAARARRARGQRLDEPRQRVGAVGDEDEGCHTRRREDQHRQLAHRVPAAQVDERDVDDVLAVPELVGQLGEPLRDRLLDPRARWRRSRRGPW